MEVSKANTIFKICKYLKFLRKTWKNLDHNRGVFVGVFPSHSRQLAGNFATITAFKIPSNES